VIAIGTSFGTALQSDIGGAYFRIKGGQNDVNRAATLARDTAAGRLLPQPGHIFKELATIITIGVDKTDRQTSLQDRIIV